MIRKQKPGAHIPHREQTGGANRKQGGTNRGKRETRGTNQGKREPRGSNGRANRTQGDQTGWPTVNMGTKLGATGNKGNYRWGGTRETKRNHQGSRQKPRGTSRGQTRNKGAYCGSK